MKQQLLAMVLFTTFCGFAVYILSPQKTLEATSAINPEGSSARSANNLPYVGRSRSGELQLSTPAPVPPIADLNDPINSYLYAPELTKENTQDALITTSPTATPSDDTDILKELSVEAEREEKSPTVSAADNNTTLDPQNNHAGRVGGIRAPVEPPVATNSATPTPSTKLPRVVGQARGITMLYLMHPQARAAVEKQIEIIKKAEIGNVYLGVLTDGTFDVDYEYLHGVLNSLSEDNRTITLVLYLTNGATQRKFDTTPITAGFNQIDPTLFRELIKEDPAIRATFKKMAEDALPVLDYNLSLNSKNSNYVIVMLEDNLDAASYEAMRDIAAEVIGNSATMMRNPCPGDECWEGNDMESFGDPIELHAPSDLPLLGLGDGYSLDGQGYALPGDPATSLALTPDEVKSMEAASVTAGLAFFGLWRAESQGIENGVIVHPSLRNYEILSDADGEVVIDMLRSGLTEQP
jgi:hypothetical protein